MIMAQPLPFVRAFIDAVDETIRQHSPQAGLSTIQRAWLAFCLTATLVTNSICWARFERVSLGAYSLAALSWMFRQSKLPWDRLLVTSVRIVLRHYGLNEGSLVVDDRLFAIIWVGSKSFHNRLISVFSGCVHFAAQRRGVESA